MVFFAVARLYPHTPIGRRLLLAPPPPQDTDDVQPDLPHVGDRGVAMTVLRPAGSVDIAGRRVNCVSEGEIIAAGTPVEVIHVAGSRIVVHAVAE